MRLTGFIESDRKYETRVVAKLFQRRCQGNKETLVTKINILNVLLHTINKVTGNRKWNIEQKDVQMTFLNEKINSEVFIYPIKSKG